MSPVDNEEDMEKIEEGDGELERGRGSNERQVDN
jgi:hypothetical protein